MLTIHDESDTAILSGWTYFTEWRSSGNFLLLLDALERLNHAERTWTVARGSRTPIRREWQVLRRCVMRGMARLRRPLLDANTPAKTERAIYRGGKRATLARTDQLNDRAVTIAMLGSGSKRVDYDRALVTLAEWGIFRQKGYLMKRASELGLTQRRRPRPKRNLPAWPKPSGRIEQVGPGRLRHSGGAY
jgi:hypothetical protein